MTFIIVMLAALLTGATPVVPEMSATYEGHDLVFKGPAGASIEVLDSDEVVKHRGVLDEHGRLQITDYGYSDPMQELVTVEGKRRSLADLFPPAEIETRGPWSLKSGPNLPYARVVHRTTRQPMAGIPVKVELACFGRPRANRVLHGVTSATGVARFSGTLQISDRLKLTDRCQLAISAVGAKAFSRVYVDDRPLWRGPGGVEDSTRLSKRNRRTPGQSR